MVHVEHVEVEAKFAILDATQVDVLRTIPMLTAAYSLHGIQRVRHVDLYMDTPAFGLLRTGYALRIRHSPAGPSVAIKSLPLADVTHIHRRLELEEPLSSDVDPLTQASWPPAIRSFLAERLGAALELRPLCILSQTRDKRFVSVRTGHSEATATPFAELSIDETLVFGPEHMEMLQAGQVNADECSSLAVFWEAEAELLPGQNETDLAMFVQKLARTPRLRSLSSSKFERALEVVYKRLSIDGHLYKRVEPTMHIADACRLIWRKYLMAMVLNEPGVRYSGDVAYVRNMRVATRRMRVALHLFGRYFRRKRIYAFTKALRKTARLLGAVRDRDVAIAKLAKHREAKQAKSQYDAIMNTWRRKRDQAFGALLSWLNSASYARFVHNFTDFCAQWGKGVKTLSTKHSATLSPFQVRHVMPEMLLTRFMRVRVFELLIDGDAPITGEMLHRLRIRCKFLRYNLEFVEHLLGPGAAKILRVLKHLQKNLGDVNDAIVTLQMLRTAEPTDNPSSLDEYDAKQAADIETLRHAVYDSIGQFLSPASRRRFAQAIAHI